MRLNSIHRQTIANRAEKSPAFLEREAELSYRSNSLAMQCWHDLFSSSDRKACVQVSAAWIVPRHSFAVNVAGARIVLTFTLATPLPPGGYNGTDIVATCLPGNLADQIMAWAGDVETLRADRKKAKAAVTALLESVSTVETLASIWPEGQQFYADLEIRKPDLPTIIGTDINKMLGVV